MNWFNGVKLAWFNGVKLAWRLCIAGVTLVIILVALAWGIVAGMFLLGVFLFFAGFAVAAAAAEAYLDVVEEKQTDE